MKKKIIIPIIVCCLIAIIAFYFLWVNRTVSTITLDINPSIEIKLKKNEAVKKVIALNDDAKTIIDSTVKGQSFEDTINKIIDRYVEGGYPIDRGITIILHTEGEADIDDFEHRISVCFVEKNIHPEMIVVKDVTKEDRKLARKYHITPAKAAYINALVNTNENLSVDNLVNRSVNELKNTKETGKYCHEDYVLDGDFCIKKIGEEPATPGKVCPAGYYDYKGTCYEGADSIETDKLVCRDEFTLNEKMCTRMLSTEAKPVKWTCNQGEAKTRVEMGLTGADAGDANYVVCVDYSNATHPVTPCELPASDPTERMSAGGKCYWHRAPVIAEGCPGKIQVGGECWDDATNIYICEGYRDGKQYASKSEYCEHSIKYIDPVVTEYTCEEEGFTVNGSKCEKEETEKAMYERVCPAGYSMNDDGNCVNYEKTIAKEDGYICERVNTNIFGDTCYIYDIIAAEGGE